MKWIVHAVICWLLFQRRDNNPIAKKPRLPAPYAYNPKRNELFYFRPPIFHLFKLIPGPHLLRSL